MSDHILQFEQIGSPYTPYGEKSFESEIEVKDFLLKYGFKNWTSCSWTTYKDVDYYDLSQYVCGSIKAMYINLIKNKNDSK